MGNKAQNQRKSLRFSRQLQAWMRTEEGTFRRITLLNISQTGARLATGEVPGSELVLNIKLERGQYLSLRARKVWQRALTGAETYLAGVEFLFEHDSLHCRILERWTNVQACLEPQAA